MKDPGAPAPRAPHEQQVRDRVHATALRLGLILRTYVQNPEKRDDTRRIIGELLTEMRTLRNPLVQAAQAPAGTVDAEIDRLMSLLGALQVVLDRLEALETSRAAERRAETKLEEVRRDWETLQQELAQVEDRARKNEEDKRMLEEALRAVGARASGDLTTSEHRKMKSEIDRLASALEASREERESLQKKLDAATRMATDYQSRLASARRELEAEKAKVGVREEPAAGAIPDAESEGYARRIEELERENATLRDSLDRLMAEAGARGHVAAPSGPGAAPATDGTGNGPVSTAGSMGDPPGESGSAALAPESTAPAGPATPAPAGKSKSSVKDEIEKLRARRRGTR